MDLGLKGRRALIMGASRGLGRAVAEALLAEGAVAAICARNADRCAGLHGLVNALSKEIAEAGVTVNAVMPGYTLTERLVEIGVDQEEVARRIPARRMGDPAEFAAPVAFLASDRAGYVTGQAVACDGGLMQSI